MQRVVIAALMFGLWLSGAAAQTWPSGPIRWLVGFPPGGTADMISREIAGELEKVLGQPVVFDRVFIPGDRFRITRELHYEPSSQGAHA